jgi:hypothetical protein
MAAAFNDKDRWHFAAKVFFSLLFGLPCLCVALKGQPPDSVKWAMTMVGVIIGYWVK